MGTYEKSNDASFVNFFIGLIMLVFLGLVVLWIIKVVVGVVMAMLPIMGIGLAVGGGWWYLNAKNEHYRLRAMSTVAGGLFLLLLSMIF